MTDTPAPTTPRTLAELDRLAAELHARVITSEGMETMMRLAYERGLAEARVTPAEALDVERLAATEWAYDTMPESFDVVRDPVKVWNDRLYPATDHDKDRYRRRAAAIVARLSQHTIESQ